MPGLSSPLIDAGLAVSITPSRARVSRRATGQIATLWGPDARGALRHSHRFLTLRTSARTVPTARARLMEMRMIPGMRVGRAAHDTRPPGVESAVVALRDRGFRLTAPRHAVLEVIRASRRIPLPRKSTAGAHHHFTCLRCGRIADVEAPAAEPPSRALSQRVEARSGLHDHASPDRLRRPVLAPQPERKGSICLKRIRLIRKTRRRASAKARPRQSPRQPPSGPGQGRTGTGGRISWIFQFFKRTLPGPIRWARISTTQESSKPSTSKR